MRWQDQTPNKGVDNCVRLITFSTSEWCGAEHWVSFPGRSQTLLSWRSPGSATHGPRHTSGIGSCEKPWVYWLHENSGYFYMFLPPRKKKHSPNEKGEVSTKSPEVWACDYMAWLRYTVWYCEAFPGRRLLHFLVVFGDQFCLPGCSQRAAIRRVTVLLPGYHNLWCL